MTHHPSETESKAQRPTLWAVVGAVILVLAVASRLYLLGERATSHDETTHALFSWNLYAGQGFRHDPMMHGPLLFEASALFYFLFGVSDFTARLYTALTGIALVMAPLLFRKWLGRAGALFASVLLLISPSITYYSRYTRHDVPMILFALLLLWTVLNYLDTGRRRWLYGMAVCFPLMYATKENAYIYTALFLGLLTLPFARQILGVRWRRPELWGWFLGALALVVVLGLVFAVGVRSTGAPPEEEASDANLVDIPVPWWGRIAAGGAFLAAFGALYCVYRGVGEARLRQSRVFDVLMALGTLTLPLGSAVLIKFVGGVSMEAFYPAMMNQTFDNVPMGWTLIAVGITLLSLVGSGALGVWWRRRDWPIIALIHYGLFFILYSSLFTWGYGILTGLIGGLAYWLGQQGVERGTQPWYYYPMIGSLYEYLALSVAVGTGVAVIARRAKAWIAALRRPPEDEAAPLPPLDAARYLPLFLMGWAALSWIAYIAAGEKMPWLFTHIAFPHALLAAWGLGRCAQGLTGRDLVQRGGWALLVGIPLLGKALVAVGQAWPPILQALRQGDEGGLTLAQAEPFGQLFAGVVGIVVLVGLIVWAVGRAGTPRRAGPRHRAGVMYRPRPHPALRLSVLTLGAVLAAFTLRTMVMLNYINPELAKEFMVYAHATPDVKRMLRQIEDISWRLTGTPNEIKVAYGKGGSWPFYWYMRTQYPNSYYYDATPDAAQLRECPVIIAGRDEWNTVEGMLEEDYITTDYKYLWWPIEDYKGLTGEQVRAALADPQRRAALWDIIWARDYLRYAQLKNPEAPFTLKTWPHREDVRFYVRRDLAAQVWRYRADGATDATAGLYEDPYQDATRSLTAASVALLPNAAPRGLAVAADGTLYVADAAQHRVWHITAQGEVLHTWGEYGVAPGQFNAPGDVAVDAEGHVYVADTWNHRVQVFDEEGQYLRDWGRLMQINDPQEGGYGAFYGPRGIAVNADGEIYVTDTGNRRVQIFDAEGTFLRAFGRAGAGTSELDEPVGIAVSPEGEVYIADTWNHRVQVFTQIGIYAREWDVVAWGSGLPDEKPYLAYDDGRVYVSDPANQRVLAFEQDGPLLWSLSVAESLTFPLGLAVADGVLYVTDAETGQVLGYRLP